MEMDNSVIVAVLFALHQQAIVNGADDTTALGTDKYWLLAAVKS